MATTPYYAFTRSLDPNLGVPKVVSGAWPPGAPMAEVALRVLRTPKGMFLPDPTLGVDYSESDRGGPNAAAILQNALVAAFARFTQAGRILNLKVEVERRGDRLFYEVSFFDPRLPLTGRVGPLRGVF